MLGNLMKLSKLLIHGLQLSFFVGGGFQAIRGIIELNLILREGDLVFGGIGQ
jgi:hypothetical protein